MILLESTGVIGQVQGSTTQWVLLIFASIGLLLGVGVRLYQEGYDLDYLLRSIGIERTEASETPVESTPPADPDPPVTDREPGSPEGGQSTNGGGTAIAYDEVVQAAFTHLRQQVTDSFGIHPGVTHWDFYQECTEADIDVDMEALSELTGLYERSVYDSGSLDEADAERAIECAKAVLRSTDMDFRWPDTAMAE